jgi:thiosulfate/3-mercaptopyruvate sulfurtransferase
MIRKLAITIFLATAVAAFGQLPARPDAIVTTEWLAQHANDPDLVIIQVGHMDDGVYEKGHIPGARLLQADEIADMHDRPGTELLPVEKEKQNLEQFGLTDHSHVVAYAPSYDPLATRLLWTLDYLGFRGKASLLEGGLQKWTAEKRQISSDTPAPLPRGSLTITPHPEVLVKLDYVNRLISGDSAANKDTLIDSRPARRYMAGHIPSAQNFYWEDMLVNKETRALRPPDELRQMYARAGVSAGKRSISYCEVGQQASYTYWIARYLGLDAAMYDGSWMEYSSADGERVVKGDQPR